MSRTLKQIIEEVDTIKPNAFSPEQKVAWLNSLEGRIQTDIWLRFSREMAPYDWKIDQNTQVLIEPPHDDIYGVWLQAQIDFANGEYDKYQNTMAVYNALWGDYLRYFARTYEPAKGFNENRRRPATAEEVFL